MRVTLSFRRAGLASNTARAFIALALVAVLIAVPIGAATASQGDTYRDEFSGAFSGSDGSLSWTSDWLESGESDGPGAGAISVDDEPHCLTDPCLVLGKGGPAATSVEREADLSGIAAATLRFDFKRHAHDAGTGRVELAVSSDGGGGWTVLDTWDLSTTDPEVRNAAYGISSLISANTRIRFRLIGSADDSHLNVDNLEIAEGRWAQIDPRAGDRLNGVVVADASTAYVVGDNGTILATSDGGATWERQAPGVAEHLHGASFSEPSKGLVVGDSGVVVQTSNGGNSWSSRNSGTTENLNEIQLVTATVAYVAGDNGTLLKTVNGGTAWSQLTSGTTNHLRATFFTATDTGYAVGGDGTILKTNDGATWTPLPSPVAQTLHSVHFVDSSTGVIVGNNGTILKTIDGATWTQVASPTSDDLESLYFTTATVGYAVGQDGAILSTIDGGDTWSVQPGPTNAALHAVHFSAGLGFAVGDSGTIIERLEMPQSPPVLSDPGDQAAGVDTPFELTVRGDDVNADPFTVTITDLPAWAGYVDNGDGTATVSGTPSDSDLGATTVTATLDDGYGSSVGTFVIHVVELGSFYLVANAGTDILTAVDSTDPSPATNEVTIGDTGTGEIESLDFQPGTGVLFGVDHAQVGTMNPATGAFSPKPFTVGAGNGPRGLINFDDINGIAFDPANGRLYGTHYVGVFSRDVLFEIDPATGALVAGAFAGDDYVTITGPSLDYHMHDLAFDPATGQLYGINFGFIYRLVTIDPGTGGAVAVGPTRHETQGLAFDSGGRLWGSTGNGSSEEVLHIDKADGSVISSIPIDNGSLYEALAITGNQAPIFDQDLPDRSDAEGTAISLSSAASDGDPGDVLTYSATGLPPGLSVDPLDGSISGTISATGAGVYAVEIAVTDDGVPNLANTDDFTWTVTNVNEPPVFDQDLLDRSDPEGAIVVISSGATDPDLDTLTYAAAGLPEGLSIDSATGRIYGSPSPSAEGIYAVTITVTDGGSPSLQDIDTFIWTITSGTVVYLVANQGGAGGGDDLLTVADPTNTDPTTNEVGIGIGTGSSNVEAVALQPGTDRLFAVEGDWLGTIDLGSGTFSPLPQIAGAGNGSVGLVAFNNIEGLSFEPFSGALYATHRRGNYQEDLLFLLNPTTGAHVPGAFSGDDYVAIEARPPNYHAADIAFDPTDGTLYGVHWDLSGNWSIAILDPDTGATSTVGVLPDDVHGLAFDESGRLWGTTADTPGPYFMYEIDKTNASIASTVPIDNGSNYEAIAISFPLAANLPPAFDQDLIDRADAEGAPISLSAAATDPDAGNTLSYGATGLPPGLAINPGTGLISGTISFTSAGSHVVTITATDDGIPNLSAPPDTFTWTVAETNQPPAFDQDLLDRVDVEGAVISLSAAATDPDAGDQLGYGAAGLPPGLSIEVDSGLITGTINFSAAAGSPYAVTITVTDDGVPPGSAVPETFVWTVGNTNRAPVMSNPGAQTTPELAPFSLTVTASDPDGGFPSITDSGTLPAWATLVDNGNGTATISGSPGIGDSGTTSVTLTASDGALTDDAVVSLTVTNTNVAPAVADPGPQTTPEASAFSLVVTASDPDGTTPSLSAAGFPGWAMLVDNGDGTAILSGTPGYDDAGVSTVTVTATDGSLSGDAVFDITVTETNRPPIVDPVGDQTVAEGDPFSLTVIASDPDGAVPSLSVGGTVPGWATFLDNGDGTATISGSPGFTDAASSTVTITASDGALTGGIGFDITVTNTNRAPIVGAVPSQTVAENDPFLVVVTATDPDGTLPSIAATGLPAWATLVDNGDGTATISGTPEFDDAAVGTVTISAEDGGVPNLADSRDFTLTVTNTNRPPAMTDPGSQTAAEGSPFSLTVYASDPDGSMPSFADGGTLPSWATLLDSGDGTATISGTPGYSDSGSTTVSIIASDGALTDQVDFDIVVVNTNRAPVLDPIPDQVVAEQAPFSLTVAASDPDGATPSITAGGTLPSWATLVDNGDGTATITGSPGYTDAALTTVTIAASDGSLTGTASFDLTVTNTNQAPVVDPIPDQVVAEGTSFALVVSSSDPDGATPAVSAAGLPSWTTLLDNGDGTATITGIPGYTDATLTTVTITASDGSLTGTATFTLTVTNTNQAPVVDPIPDQSTPEGAAFSLTVAASDPDGATPAVSAAGLPSWTTLLDNGDGTATITGTPGYTDATLTTVTITASDGSLTGTATFTLTVTNTNQAPVVDPIPDQSIAEGTTSVFVVSASDPDGTTPTLSASGLRTWATLLDNGDGTATIIATPGFAAAGTSTVTVTAGDGSLNGAANFTFIVTNTNRAPVVDPITDQPAAEGSAFSITVVASDPDGTTPALSATGLPAWATLIDRGDGTATITGTPGYSDASVSTVIITASDGNLTDAEAFALTVTNTNRAPFVDPIPDQTIAENAAFDLVVAASDPDDTTPAITATGLPAWATLVDNGGGTATITGAPGFTDAGNSTIAIHATDGSLTGTRKFDLTVTNTNRPPGITNPGPQSLPEDHLFDLELVAVDADGDEVTISASGIPTWAVFTTGPGWANIQGTPDAEDAGTTSVSITASDGADPTSVTFTIEVTVPNRAPGISTGGSAAGVEGATFGPLTIAASDPDGTVATITTAGLPPWASFTTSGNGAASITGTPGYTDAGRSVVSITATDPGGLATSIDLEIEVANTNRLASVEWTGGTSVGEGAPLAPIAITAVDPDGDPLTIALAAAPPWIAIDIAGGADATIFGTPGYDAAGSHVVRIEVSDGTDATRLEFTIDVVDTNRVPAPVNESITIDAGETATLAVLDGYTDPDGDPLRLIAVGRPDQGTTSIVSGRTIVYEPAPGFAGADSFSYTVEDERGGAFTSTVSVTVLAAYLAAYTDKAVTGLLIESMDANLTAPELQAAGAGRELTPTDGMRVAFGAAAESLKSQILPALLLGILIAWLLILGVGRRNEEETA